MNESSEPSRPRVRHRRRRHRRPFLRRHRVALSVVAALVVVCGVWLAVAVAQASALTRSLSELESVGVAGLTSDAHSTGVLSGKLESAQGRLANFSRTIIPVRVGATLFGWFPVFGQDLRAARSTVSRAQSDLQAASEALTAATDLQASLSSVATARSADNALTALQDPTLQSTARAATARLESAQRLLGATSSDPLVPARSIPLPLLSSAIHRVSTAQSRLVSAETNLNAAVDWAVGAGKAAQQLPEVAGAAQPLLDALSSGSAAGLQDPASLARDLRTLQTAASSSAVDLREGNAAATNAIRQSALGEQLDQLSGLLGSLATAAGGGAEGLDAIAPAVQTLSNAQGGLLHSGPTLLAAISQMGQQHAKLEDAAGRVQRALDQMTGGTGSGTSTTATSTASQGSDWAPLKTKLVDVLQQLHGGLVLARDLPSIAPQILGADGPRTYLVLGETSDELRATGGFVSAVWQVTFDHGALVGAQYHDVVQVDDLKALNLYPPPPPLLQKYMDAQVWLMRDVTWEPDFPSTGQMAEQLYWLGQHQKVDGVIAISEWAFVALSQALGPIPTPSGPIQPGGLLNALQNGTDQHGRAYMNEIFQGVIQSLGSGGTGRDFDLAASLANVLSERQMLVYLSNASAEQVVKQLGWAGALADPKGDRLVPIDSNVGWSKVDRNIERSLTYRVALDPSGPAQANATLTYRNVSGPNATGCTSQRENRGDSYTSLMNTCYWDLVRLYAGQGATLVHADPMPLPPHSVLEESGGGVVGQSTLNVSAGPGGSIFAGLITVAPGATKSVGFSYTLPNSVVDWHSARPTYSLTLQPQPGTRGRQTTVFVVIPPGYRYEGSSLTPTSVQGNTVRFDFDLLRDTVVTVTMGKG